MIWSNYRNSNCVASVFATELRRFVSLAQLKAVSGRNDSDTVGERPGKICNVRVEGERVEWKGWVSEGKRVTGRRIGSEKKQDKLEMLGGPNDVNIKNPDLTAEKK